MAIPKFNKDGNLPRGIHVATWAEFEQRFAITTHRKFLVGGLKDALTIFSKFGCQKVYVDGSYVTAKSVPNDYDMAWDPAGVDLHLLKVAEPLFFDFTNQRAGQKAKYFGEFFPSTAIADSIGTRFVDFFQVDKNTNKAKGIITLDIKGGIK